MHSIDETGVALRTAIEDLKIVPEGVVIPVELPQDPPSAEIDESVTQSELALPRTWVSPPSPSTVATVPVAPQPADDLSDGEGTE